MVTEALIARCVREDPKAQSELYRTLYAMMMSICTRYERDRQEASARMNQGFLKILQNLEKRRPEVPFEPWARRILINTVIDCHRRDQERKANEFLDAEVETNASDVNAYLREMESEAFLELLQQLPPMSRNVFNLFAVDGYGHKEIGEMFGISEGTSKWHVSHARQLLQKAIRSTASTHTSVSSIR